MSNAWDIVLGAAISILSSIAIRFYETRPILMASLVYGGFICAAKIENVGVFPARNVRIEVFLDKNRILNESVGFVKNKDSKIFVLEKEGKTVYLNELTNLQIITVVIRRKMRFPQKETFLVSVEKNKSLLRESKKDWDIFD